MSHFYGTLDGQAGQATRRGSKKSGLTTKAASWAGAVVVDLRHDEKTGKDHYTVRQAQWHNRGIACVIAEGIIGEGV